jgi:hypothetical protein
MLVLGATLGLDVLGARDGADNVGEALGAVDGQSVTTYFRNVKNCWANGPANLCGAGVGRHASV